MNELDIPIGASTSNDRAELSLESTAPATEEAGVPTVDPVRAAAGRLGGRRVHQLAELGREYERKHGLKAGRQRLKQLIQLGKKYELEQGLRIAKPRRRKTGDAWYDFLSALGRVIKPAHRAAVEQLVAALRPNSSPVRGSDVVPEKAA